MEGNNKKEYKDWYKTLKRIQKKELILAGVLILLAFIFVGISENAYEWFKIIKIYYVLDDNPLINIPICIIISGFAIWWWRKIWKDKDIRPYRLGIILFLFSILVFDNNFTYANIVGIINYKIFFLFLLKVSFYIMAFKFFLIPVIISNFWKFIVELSKKVKGYFKEFIENSNFYKEIQEVINTLIYKQDNKPELNGFSVDNTEIKLEDNQIKYAETLVKKLKNTDLSKESFAVGITGEWGSGKSTFLNTMKKEIEEAKFAEIVEFNPWLCNSPEQVTQDFFATLIDKLSPKHSTLSRTINKYAKLLNKIAKPSLSFFGIDLDLTPGDDSLNKLKENISNKLEKLPKKVVILIDNTDRLEGNEVFEILRLIRNTADFKNVIYIATYDKEYVTDVLKENKIEDPDNYLEKIFQVEVHLLKVEDSELWDTLKEEIEANFSNFNNKIKINYSDFSFNDRELVSQILSNYRQVKRFARQFTAYLDYLNKKGSIEDFSFLDLFWLELLQTYDKKVYNTLAKDRYSLLKRYNNSDDVYKLRPLNYNRDWKEKTKEILTIIFPDNNDIDDIKRMRFFNNYFSYFSLNASQEKLHAKEMREMLRSTNPEEILYNWIENNKDYNSIIFQFSYNKINFNNTLYLRNYIFGLLYFAFYYNSSSNYDKTSYPNDIKYLLRQERYSNFAKNAIDIAKTWLEKVTKNYHEYHYLLLTTLLNKLHARTKEDKNYNLIISDATMQNYLLKIIKEFIKRRDHWHATDILQKRHTLRFLFEDCCVQSFDENGNEYYKQIALKIVIDHFSKKTNKPTFEEFDKVYKENFDYDNMTNDKRNKIDTELTKLFGSNYKNHIQIFKQTCFTQN